MPTLTIPRPADPHAPWRESPLFDDAVRAIDAKTKPVGALGQLEVLAIQLACLQATLAPRVTHARAIVFAADHGVADDGVSAYPRSVTAQMVANFAAGGAAICVLARAADASLEVVDVGVDADATPAGVIAARVRRGTRNLRLEPAMTPTECEAALAAGRDAAARAIDAGADAILLGEMGIGNTTAAAALTSAFTNAAPEQTVGRGSGIDDAALARKRTVVHEALARHAPLLDDPRATLGALGGLEIAAMTGAAIAAAAARRVVLVDGYIATAAALAAVRLAPTTRRALVFAHRGAEPGHAIALAALDATPLLALDLRLGEGTGAALALPLVRAAARLLDEMATFTSAGVSGPA
jgi:nicotinate-nucleotide--dimethylbenzimidazole phosphoribosyltransferase